MVPGDLNSTGLQYLKTQNRELALSSSTLHSFISPLTASTLCSGDRSNSVPPVTILNNQRSLSKYSPTFEELPPLTSHHPTSHNRFVPFTPTMEQDARRFNTTEHIPRPPNAFMLYRSDFLKRRPIPREVEHRQQNLSRIAGQCWNLLSEEERDVWHDQAAAVRAAHYAKYPFYKFRPNRKMADKAVIKRERKSSLSGNITNQDPIRPLREDPKGITSVGPIRRTRTTRPRPRASPYVEGMFAALHTPLLPSFTLSTPASSSSSPLSPLSPLSLLLPFTLQEHFRYPSSGKSQLHVNQGENMLGLELGSSQSLSTNDRESISDLIRGLDITPAAATCHENNIDWQYENDFAYLGLEELQLPYSSLLNYPSSAHFSSSPAPSGCSYLSYCSGSHNAQLAISQPRLTPAEPSVSRGLGCDEHYRT